MFHAMRFRIHETRKIEGKTLWVAALLVVLLLIVGCAGVEPFEPRNNREEGPEKGLFTGTRGEWVILGPEMSQKRKEEKTDAAQDSEADTEEMKQPEEPANAD